ncbi:hypothetical protein [Nocardia yunnanensis]|uniref:hypothetical protein n=1 Tax=Nocardia yunnanensis TaxID=2382165 RepID=UPI001CA3CC04|nr:hypothetical protein [Nocardia yunnanensis]
MVVEWDEAQLIAVGFEHVVIELEWYNGPRSGVAQIGGRPHYFDRGDCDADDAGAAEFRVWPASEEAVAWEFEQWAAFVDWDQRYRAGTAGTDSHPGYRGIDARYDKPTDLREPHRQGPPRGGQKLLGEWRSTAGIVTASRAPMSGSGGNRGDGRGGHAWVKPSTHDHEERPPVRPVLRS